MPEHEDEEGMSPLSSPPRWTPIAVLALAVAAWAALVSRGAILVVQPAAGAGTRTSRAAFDGDGDVAPPDVVNRTTIDDGSSSRRLLFANVHLERTVYKLPPALEHNLADWDHGIPSAAGATEATRDLPMFWHVLKSGGTTIKLMYAQCYRLVEACETGVLVEAEQEQRRNQPSQQQQLLPSVDEGQGGHPSPWEWMQQQQQQQQAQNSAVDLDSPQRRRRLEPMPYSPSEEELDGNDAKLAQQEAAGQLRVVISEDGRRYVNVDVTTPDGILHASELGFASSDLADVLFTPLLLESAQSLVTSSGRRGRAFALFRHPVERVVSIFHYLQRATWEPTYDPRYASWTVDEYANSPECESNWMVRSLIDKMTGPLSPDDVLVAKDVLRRKCLVGLLDRMEESVVRFHRYFGFGDEEALRCARDRFVGKGSGSNSHTHPKLDRRSETWAILERKNSLDLRLYEYAQQLFVEQGELLRREKVI